MAKTIAAIGSDGVRAIVWGLGESQESAEADALEQDGGSKQYADHGFVYVELSPERAQTVRAGNINADDLVESDGDTGIRARRATPKTGGTTGVTR